MKDVVIDLKRFVQEERPLWCELERMLDAGESDWGRRWSLTEARRYHYLHGRLAHGLSRLSGHGAQGELRIEMSLLLSRSHAFMTGREQARVSWRPWHWFAAEVPRAFRRRFSAFALAVLMTLAGSSFGAGALLLDPSSKEVLMPFPHLLDTPGERVAREEGPPPDSERGGEFQATFAAQLMTHNVRVSLFVAALGAGWGAGTIVLLFYNGAILGAVCADYLAAGYGLFLAGWLLPHGSVEIPAILIGGQAGLVIAGAVIGRGDRAPLRRRLRNVAGDVVHLLGALALLLVWAGMVESFCSQTHEPRLPYGFKICFGSIQLLLLMLWLWKGGRPDSKEEA